MTEPTPAQPAGSPAVTIAVVPRERFSVALSSLDSIYANTAGRFELVYVDGNAPRAVRDALRAAEAQRGFILLRTDRYLSPNQARNLALSHVRTPYVAFVDNDVFVNPGWLDALVECAEETGAWVVGPLAFEGAPEERFVHNAGGFFRFDGPEGRRDLIQDNRYGHRNLDALLASGQPTRFRVDYVEFHCVLVRRAAFDAIGPLDEALLSTREHLDLCLRVAEAGGEVWSETTSQVTYDNPPPVAWSDLPYFTLRWSEAWNRSSLEHFAAKYGLGPDYLQRAAKSRARRHVVFEPASRAVHGRLGSRAGHASDRAMRLAERAINTAVVGGVLRRRAFAAR